MPSEVPLYPLMDLPENGMYCGLSLSEKAHAAWIAYHLTLDGVWFEVTPLPDDQYEIAVKWDGRERLRLRASAYFNKGVEIL